MTTIAKKGGKKTGAKRDLKKAKRVLARAEGAQCFWVTNGAIISTLVDLSNLLGEMETSVYRYHVTKDKNDFADWVEFVLGDRELALALRKAKQPKSA
ncbi:MAG TPA: hypothetical protein VFS75_02295, partial [Candidatus Paceibacterota bacterium]|nr:hypothetical protein [Candidatus Paceibacterota bacterium]